MSHASVGVLCWEIWEGVYRLRGFRRGRRGLVLGDLVDAGETKGSSSVSLMEGGMI